MVNILLIDDDTEVLTINKKYLSGEGYTASGEVDIVSLLDEYFYDILCEKRFKQRNLKIYMVIDYPIYMNIVIHKLIRVLDNLFTNALNFKMLIQISI